MRSFMITCGAAAICFCLTLAGCTATGLILSDATGAIEEAVDNIDLPGMEEEIAAAMASVPSIGEILDGAENPEDHRQTQTLPDGGQTAVRFSIESASQVILRQEGKEYSLEYDPEHFTVETSEQGEEIVLSIASKGKRASNGKNYYCLITLPEREFSQISLACDHAGVALSGVNSPVKLQGANNGMAFDGLPSRLEVESGHSAFAADVPADYQGSFSYTGDNAAFALRFAGEPEGFSITGDFGSSQAVAYPTAWGSGIGSFSYGDGDKAVFSLKADWAAGAISLEGEDQ